LNLSYDEKYYNDIYYCHEERTYQLKRIVGNQTIYMEFSEIELDRNAFVRNDCRYYNVCLTIYNKSKDMYTNMDKHLSTGKDPIRNFIIARKMFDALEAKVVQSAIAHNQDVAIVIHWEDNRRRDAYYKVLSRKGYRYATMPWGTKVIMKKFKWKDWKVIVDA
jgi:hypothetical protein